MGNCFANESKNIGTLLHALQNSYAMLFNVNESLQGQYVYSWSYVKFNFSIAIFIQHTQELLWKDYLIPQIFLVRVKSLEDLVDFYGTYTSFDI